MASHFGTFPAAWNRLGDLLLGSGSTTKQLRVEDAYIYPALLKIQNPLHVEDCWGNQNVGVGAEKIAATHKTIFTTKEQRYLKEPLEFIGREGYAMPIETIRRELTSKPHFPTPDLSIYLSRDDQNYFGERLLREQLATIRLYETLMKHGFDGLSYDNYEEGRGTVSWVTCRPDQTLLMPFRLKYGLDETGEPLPLQAGLQPLTKVRAAPIAVESKGNAIKNILKKIGLAKFGL